MKPPLLSVVKEEMTGVGFGVAVVDGGVMIRVTLWPDTAVVSDLTRSPEMVALLPARMVSGVKVKERIVVVLLGGTTMVKVEEMGAEVLLPLEARAYMVQVMPSRQVTEPVFKVQEVVPEAVSQEEVRAKLPLLWR